ncbi:hypothetical protein FVE85_2942 [Porphyridium purpureum]|uniref:Uncharacterized protein n=1 Tax=Porphyridium purpureum TaxID=35688 RepID=A0A5J4YT65_PORPP|nr:hypothetical protein FVE85_2942 [Porphyridium purpureum]|eukprot:POR5918..scf227_4
MAEKDDFSEPTSMVNFLQRYHSAKEESKLPRSDSQVAGSSPVLAPKKMDVPDARASAIPRSTSNSQSVWTAVFHPSGSYTTGKSMFDRAPSAGMGQSTSEIIDLSDKPIQLDGRHQ